MSAQGTSRFIWFVLETPNLYPCLLAVFIYPVQICKGSLAPWIPLKQPEWKGWKFSVFSRALDDIEEAEHPDLSDLSIRLVSPSNIECSWRAAFSELGKGDSENAALLKTVFGVTRQVKRNHALLRQPYLREWVNDEARCCSVEGTISECYEVHGKGLVFTVEVERASVELANRALGVLSSVPERLRNIDLDDALGGLVLARRTYNLPPIETSEEGALLWHVPRLCDNRPVRTIEFRGFTMELRVLPTALSREGANQGCFVKCESISPATKLFPALTLRANEFIDLGVYGPPTDVVPIQQFLSKVSVHSHATGNVLSFVNETGCSDEPCVVAQRDPSGQVSQRRAALSCSFGALPHLLWHCHRSTSYLGAKRRSLFSSEARSWRSRLRP